LKSCYHFSAPELYLKSVLFLQVSSIAGATSRRAYQTLVIIFFLVVARSVFLAIGSIICTVTVRQVDISVDTNARVIAGLPELQFVNQVIKYMVPFLLYAFFSR
jgi:hypothetical protein